LPDRWETGTQVQELIAGIAAAVDYLAELGRRHEPGVKDRRSALLAAYRVTHEHEMVCWQSCWKGCRVFARAYFWHHRSEAIR